METTAAQAAKAALEALTTPPAPSPLSIDAEKWDWQWELTGIETPEERAKLDEMLRAAKAFIADIVAGQQPHWISFLGGPASGKTHLADRIRWFLKKKGEAIYNRTVRAENDPMSERVDSIFSYAQEGAVLAKWGTIIEKLRNGEQGPFLRACGDYFKIIDDLGVDSFNQSGEATPFAIQKMAELCDRRLRKWTVITSNFDRKALATKFDSRIASRLMRDGSQIIDCSGIRDFNIRLMLRKAA